jgi:mono/diheme cytochrome c family protein
MEMTMRATARTIAAILAVILIVAAAPHAQSKSVWDGVYSSAQAKRGEGVYAQQCVTCHGADLKGKEDLKPDPSPSLTSSDLGIDFNDLTLDALADRIRTTMPKDKPNTLSREQVADVVAFILSKNGMPAGKADLPGAADQQKDIKYLTAKP